jgi:hypothetical protein
VRYVHIAVCFVYIAVRYEVFSTLNMFLYRSPGDEGANTFYKFMPRTFVCNFGIFAHYICK